MAKRKIRVLVAKPGLDGHDRGAKLMTRVLRDAGMEIVYTGYGQSPDQIVAIAIQEDVDVIGNSILSGAHMDLLGKLMARVKEKGIEDKLVIVGGTIPPKDIPRLKEMGIAEVFPTGTPPDKAVEFIKQHINR